MSVLQLDELVSYQLRTRYLDEIADGVGERLITVDESFLNSASFKAAGWRPDTSHTRTHAAHPHRHRLRVLPGAATQRRRREQMEEDDSSDLSDDSEDDSEQRAAQQIKFSKMPIRPRAGSSPIQASQMMKQQTSPREPRRGSQSALETVRERLRRDTVTSSEVSSENELDLPAAHRHRGGPRGAPGPRSSHTPRKFTRQSTIRKSYAPTKPMVLEALPPPRPLSTIRPLSIAQPQSLLSAALKAKRHKSSVPFQKFAHFSGQGTQGAINVRIYAPSSKTPNKPFEVLIRPRVHDGQGAERVVTVADLIGLSLYRFNEEKREPPIAPQKRNINWWTLRMVEEGGEVDDDFPAERTKQLAAFTVNNAGARGGGRLRSNSTVYDDFALVPATEEEFEENKSLTPQEDEGGEEEEEPQPGEGRDDGAVPKPSIPPAAPVAVPNTTRGQQKLLRIHLMSADTAPGQMVTLDVLTDTYLAEVLDLVCRKRQLDKGNHVLKLPGSGAVVMIDRPVSSIGNVSDLELYRRRASGPGCTLAREAGKQDEVGNANLKRYTVWRKQPMRLGAGVHEGKSTTVHFSNVIGCKVPRKHPANVKLVIYKATETKRYDFEARSADEAAEIVAELTKGFSPYRDVY
ncbi:SAPK-interacting protein 1 (Sin1), middle CRIM domain-containing protein [Hirsutella rhossiliensis]|uniref:SAPK-interacting protein 1 (Sin1), middle CRIM domain-containing protein n=1 Tax=Hirsutella rhossiliensis TaxID=111463 RepID=A0A9P8MWT4_9HYPO|nr:SAPK-interacting protein 1 (Sin1), middle CRIM domain-containing protein [Hirsutella rhossiliensis]KAH0960612.1 SAPK-interacting protein 1 (Sin1), middle CRIM domain-containing protein [Hirsutella rhossiliensis]